MTATSAPFRTMALAVPIPNDRKRVKVYELRDNDWFDRGTGFCTGQILNVWAFLFFFLFLFFSPRSVSLDARAPLRSQVLVLALDVSYPISLLVDPC